MDSAATTGPAVDTTLNLGLREDQVWEADRENGGGSAGMVSAEVFERVVSVQEELLKLLMERRGGFVGLVDKLGCRGEEAFMREPVRGLLGEKRRIEYCSDQEPWKRPRESNRGRVRKVYYQVDASDMSLAVKDGYQWRKYGQKVTRDNPSPRAYFKCSFAPSCPVKKKVQRSVDNQTILVATYEGEHNHRSPSNATVVTLPPDPTGGSSSARSAPHSPSTESPSPTTMSSVARRAKAEELPGLLIRHMAESLTRDPGFTSAVATAISGTVLDQIFSDG